MANTRRFKSLFDGQISLMNIRNTLIECGVLVHGKCHWGRTVHVCIRFYSLTLPMDLPFDVLMLENHRLLARY